MKILITVIITAIASWWITAFIKDSERISKESTYRSEVVLPLQNQIQLLQTNRELQKKQIELLKEKIKLIKESKSEPAGAGQPDNPPVKL
jgi:aspartyl-tRNA synthetase